MIKVVDKHDQSFFGQATGLTIHSTSKSEPFIFLRCIKKKSDNSWEKPSKGEGKTIKCILEEIVMIYQVLQRKSDSWSIYHNYKESKTQISFKWEEGKSNRLWINIGSYSKLLNFAQVEVLKLLMKHLLKEKIEHATISNISKHQSKLSTHTKHVDKERNLMSETSINEEIRKRGSRKNETSQIEGSIKGETEKAILIDLDAGQEIWIPKSGIRSQYTSRDNVKQTFLIDNWILKKNNIKV